MEQNYHEYSTGSTRPGKNHNGLVAFLLICVIFLGGLVSVLGFMNVQLFRKLDAAEKDADVSFRQGEDSSQEAKADPFPASADLWGMTLLEVSNPYRNLYDLPRGLYVAHITPGSQADALGIAAGDLLVAVNGAPVSSPEALPAISCPAELTFFRAGAETTYLFPAEED